MLRRVADSVFWTSRYLERAENVARFVGVNQWLSLGSSPQWFPLIYASGDDLLFHELYGQDYTAEAVLGFLLFDSRNPSSVLSCLQKARENARSIREVLSVSIWEAINRFYLRVCEASRSPAEVLENPSDFLECVLRSSHEVIGVVDTTLSHDEAWHFSQMGRSLERADKTSRILDVKYFVLLPNESNVGSPFDVLQWTALLESTSALHMYRQRYGRIAPSQVAGFLLLDATYPRSVRFNVAEAEASLHAITGRPVGVNVEPVEVRFSRLLGALQLAKIEDIIQYGLHQFIDGFQQNLNHAGDAIFRAFFEIQPYGGSNSRQEQRQGQG
jgi:uncharacterized alpha-E superfamily protein